MERDRQEHAQCIAAALPRRVGARGRFEVAALTSRPESPPSSRLETVFVASCTRVCMWWRVGKTVGDGWWWWMAAAVQLGVRRERGAPSTSMDFGEVRCQVPQGVFVAQTHKQT